MVYIREYSPRADTWFRSLLYIGPYKKAVKEAHDPLDFSSTCVQAQLYEFHELARRLGSYTDVIQYSVKHPLSGYRQETAYVGWSLIRG